MFEDHMIPRLPLVIKPDFDSICWTHFHVPYGTVGILQELPDLLRQKLSGFIGTLLLCGIDRFELCTNGQALIQIGTEPARVQPFHPHLSRSLREGLDLLAWWLVYSHVRHIAMIRHLADATNEQTTWSCLDCGKQVKVHREHCTNPSCDSWNKLYLCTGNPILRPVQHVA